MSTEQAAAVVEAVSQAVAQTEGEAQPSAEADAAAEAESLSSEFADGLKTYGLTKQTPAGMKHYPKATEKGAAREEPAKVATTPAEAKPSESEAKAKDTTEERPETPQEQQRRLSSGFAKLERQRKSITSREEAARAAESRLVSERSDFESKTKAEREALAKEREQWQAEQGEVLKLRKLLESDELALLDAIAEKRGISRQSIFDRLTRAMLNGGKVDPSDLKADLEKLAAQTKADAEAAALKKLDEARKADEDRAKQEADKRAQVERVEAEKNGFVSWVKGPAADAYPLLSQEDPSRVAEIAYQVGFDYARRYGKPATFEQVAQHLERVCAFEKHNAEQAAKPAQQTTTKVDSERGTGAVRTAKPEQTQQAPEKPRPVSAPQTLTNNASRLRTAGGAPLRSRSDAQRLDEALKHW